MRFRISRAVAGAAVVIGAVAILEVALVLVDFQHPPQENPLRVPLDPVAGEIEPIHARDVHQLWAPKPGALVPWGADRLDASGCRGPTPAAERTPGVLRIAALGDSTTFGYGLPHDDAWVEVLARILEDEGIPCETINAGVIGSTVSQGLERWRRVVRPRNPDVVIAAFGAVNEHVPAMGVPDEDLIRELVLQSSSFVLWARRLRSDLRILHAVAWVRDGFHGARDDGLDAETRRFARDWRPSAVGRRDWPGTRRVSPESFVASLRTLRAEVEASGARLVLLSVPRRAIVESRQPAVMLYTEALLDLSRTDGIPLADGRRALGAAIREVESVDDLFIDHFHPTALGHRLLARAVRDALPQAVVAGVR